MKIIFFLFIMMYPFYGYSQLLKGKVYVEGTDTAIPSASVYYSGTLTGTQTNTRGEFSLPVQEGKIPVVISCVGYYSVSIDKYSLAAPLNIYLKQKINILKEVVVGDDGLSRKMKIKLFKEQFLGRSANAQSCVINNIEDVVLNYDKRTRTLSASCNKPIRIVNKNLGYEIDYYLDSFIKSPKHTVFTGNFIFRDKVKMPDKKIFKNRRNAYEGSRMQFIRALWAGSLKGTRFSLYNMIFQKLAIDSLVYENDRSEKEISLNDKIIIAYSGYDHRKKLSYLSQTRPGAYIGENGFYNASLRWTGPLSDERVGDLLPYDYRPAVPGDLFFTYDTLAVPARNDSTLTMPGHLKLTSEARLTRAVVVTPQNPIDESLVVKKWEEPIRYKILGSFANGRNEMISDNVRRFFKRLSVITGLEIVSAGDESVANFIIVAGNPGDYAELITSDALAYLKDLRSSGFYYTVSEQGINYVTIAVRTSDFTEANQIWPVTQKLLLKGLGFFNNINGYKRSLFNDGINFLPAEIQSFDTRIIKALYNPSVRSGMSAEQFETLLSQSQGK